MKKKFVYLASPYMDPDMDVREQRFLAVAKIAALFMSRGILVFSPITHSHSIVLCGNLPGDIDYWYQFDKRIIEALDELWVLMLPGWEKSRGIMEEIKIATKAGKKIVYLTAEGNVVAHT